VAPSLSHCYRFDRSQEAFGGAQSCGTLQPVWWGSPRRGHSLHILDGPQGKVHDPVHGQGKVEVLALLELKARHPNKAPRPVKQTTPA